MATDKTKALAVRLPAALAKRIEDIAFEQGITVSQVIKTVLVKSL